MDTSLARLALLHPDCDPPTHPLGCGVLLFKKARRALQSAPGTSAEPTQDQILAYLVTEQYVTERQADQARACFEDPVGHLVARSLITRWDVALATAQLRGMAVTELTPGMVDRELAASIPEHLAALYHIVPIQVQGQVLTLAMADPTNVMAIADVRLLTGLEVEPVLATAADIQHACATVYGDTESNVPVAGAPCRAISLSVQARLTGPVAQVQVQQVFSNPQNETIEAVYHFPLPPGAAVYGFRVQVGDRHLEASPQANAHPRRASLLDPTFSMAIGRVGPSETVCVSLLYAERLETADGETVFRVPLIAASQYHPGPVTAIGAILETHGLPPQRLACSQHAVSHKREDGNLHIELARDRESLDRDFVLRYRMGATATMPVLLADDEHFMLTLLPPTVPPRSTPRDVVLLLDRSATMQGDRMLGARQAVARFLHMQGPQDRFRLLAFDDRLEAFDDGRLCAGDDVGQALKWLALVEPRGGTELFSIVGQLLRMPLPEDRLTYVVLITDGQAVNEKDIDGLLRDPGSRLRFYTLGIDISVNAAFLRRTAQFGRGSCDLVAPGQSLERALARLAEDIRCPVITDVELHHAELAVEEDSLTPCRMPDLFANRPATIMGRKRCSGPTYAPWRLGTVGRHANGKPWRVRLVSQRTSNEALGVLWAQARIQDLEDHIRLAAPDRGPELEAEIVRLGLQYRLLSRLTSLVLMDQQTIVGRCGWVAPAFDTRPVIRDRECNLAEPQLQDQVDAPPIVRVVNLILSQAFNDHATQVHIEPTAGPSRCLYRIAGTLHHVMSPPAHVHAPIVARLKALAGLHITPSRRTHRGRMHVRHDGHEVEIVIHIMPTMHGEAVVMHMLSGPAPAPKLAELGLAAEPAERILRTLRHGPGLTLILGPSDVGTRIAYASTHAWEGHTTRIVSMERYLEQQVTGLSQMLETESTPTVQFVANGLAQDADVVIAAVDLSRDVTGLLVDAAANRRVLLVLNSTDAGEAVHRCLALEKSLVGVLRLVVGAQEMRLLCRHCRESGITAPETLSELSLPNTFRPSSAFGCTECGFSGRETRLDWHVWPVTAPHRQALAGAIGARDVRRILMGDVLAVARQRLEKGDMDLNSYRSLSQEA